MVSMTMVLYWKKNDFIAILLSAFVCGFGLSFFFCWFIRVFLYSIFFKEIPCAKHGKVHIRSEYTCVPFMFRNTPPCQFLFHDVLIY